jgi:hypothetical protein
MRKLLLGSVAVGSLVSFSGGSLAGPLNRLAAEFDFFGVEAFTDANPPGIEIYRKQVSVPRNADTLYLTLSTTGDAHNGAASCFTALLDGGFFNPGEQGAARCADGGSTPVPGWITLLKLPNGGAGGCNNGGGGAGDCHDNSIYYQWCTAVSPGAHEVEIRMASDTVGSPVFIEQAHFYIDASRGPGCTQAGTPDEMLRLQAAPPQ